MSTLKVNRGTTWTLGINYKRDNTPVDLTGGTVRFTVKPVEWDDTMDDSSATLLKNTAGNPDGTADIVLSPADTAALAPGTYVYDVKVQEPGGDVFKIDEGKWVLDGSPTNRLV